MDVTTTEEEIKRWKMKGRDDTAGNLFGKIMQIFFL